MNERTSLKLNQDDVSRAFEASPWATKFPPILTVDQAADLLQVPKSTLYQWKSENKLCGCVQRLGKHLRFFRNRLVLNLMNKGV